MSKKSLNVNLIHCHSCKMLFHYTSNSLVYSSWLPMQLNSILICCGSLPTPSILESLNISASEIPVWYLYKLQKWGRKGRKATKCVHVRMYVCIYLLWRNSWEQLNSSPGHFSHFLRELNKWWKIPISFQEACVRKEWVRYNDTSADSIQ